MRFAIVVVALTLLPAARALGQEAVAPGDRIKVRTFDSRQTIVGTVQAIVGDRIDLVEGVSLGRSRIRTIHRSEGMGRCTRIGAIIGAVTGLAVGGIGESRACAAVCVCADPECSRCLDTCYGRSIDGVLLAAGLSGATGTGLGALIGRFIKRERWSEVQLSVTAFQASSFGRFSPAINLTWIW